MTIKQQDLADKQCEPCSGNTPALTDSEENFFCVTCSSWAIDRSDVHHIKREFQFSDFVETMRFVNEVADLAEQEGHHPDIYIFYNKLTLKLFTHAVNGLSENDFIMAAKINRLHQLRYA